MFNVVGQHSIMGIVSFSESLYFDCEAKFRPSKVKSPFAFWVELKFSDCWKLGVMFLPTVKELGFEFGQRILVTFRDEGDWGLGGSKELTH